MLIIINRINNYIFFIITLITNISIFNIIYCIFKTYFTSSILGHITSVTTPVTKFRIYIIIFNITVNSRFIIYCIKYIPLY